MGRESMESINEGMVFTNQLPAYASYKIVDWTYGTPRIWNGNSVKAGDWEVLFDCRWCQHHAWW